MLHTIAQAATDASIGSWANLTSTGIVGALLVWLITKAFPSLLERHDTALTNARDHFERILVNIDTNRMAASREGHDAAKQLSVAIDKSADSVQENTRAVEGLTRQVATIKPEVHLNPQ